MSAPMEAGTAYYMASVSRFRHDGPGLGLGRILLQNACVEEAANE
jgi:hypothetical protein